MLDPRALSEYARSHLEVSDGDLQHNLKLFQAFKRIYEQNPSLLNEILGLDADDSQGRFRAGNRYYILGLVTDKQALLISNLLNGRSQTFMQPYLSDQIWTIGRDPDRTSLPVRDRRLSRLHAAIRYEAPHGFVLYDLNSTNGSYVNGIRIRQAYALQDGDNIRLGSLNFGFFTGSEFQHLAPPSDEVLRWLNNTSAPPTMPMEAINGEAAAESHPGLEETLHFMRQQELKGGEGPEADPNQFPTLG